MLQVRMMSGNDSAPGSPQTTMYHGTSAHCSLLRSESTHSTWSPSAWSFQAQMFHFSGAGLATRYNIRLPSPGGSRVHRSLRLPKALLLIKLPQCLNQFPHVARDHRVERVHRQIDAVVGHAVLREVVRANTIVPAAGADEALARLGPFAVQLLLLPLEEPAAQDAHRPLVVFVLAPLVLALHFHLVGGALPIPDADRRFGLVDVLAAGPAGAHPLPLDVARANRHLNFVRLR